ncbi:MAG: hypothetical protein JWO91_3515 [Acidobacteriaceae bacterium]|nr:hypothetical protein [Acidobacteriaceae bacterium]
MANIAPFRALRYDPARVSLPDVVTQPYDKITPEMQDRYYAASAHNLVRIILGKVDSSYSPGENQYTQAADHFLQWRREAIFLHDAEPSLYSYVQTFVPPGGKAELCRRGFITLGQIEDYSANVVFRHEQTLAKPKADRLALLRATRAHFGQIFMLYSDPKAEIEAALGSGKSPHIELRDGYGVLHQLWRVSDPEVTELVRDKMADKKLIIADGHHRYETALNYRNERRDAEWAAVRGDLGEHSKENKILRHKPQQLAPYEMVMMTCVNMDSPGLTILPTHRVVHGLDSFSAGALCEEARSYFSVEEVDPAISAARATGLLREAGHAGTAILGVTANRAFLFDTPKCVGSNLFGGLSLRQQSLDVVQLHKCLLERVLGISEEAIRDQENISYVRDADEAFSRVRTGNANIAFLLNPVRVQQVRDIALAGEVLPQKSTDFYPKLLSGLTIYPLE